jgi:hypothetical protein
LPEYSAYLIDYGLAHTYMIKKEPEAENMCNHVKLPDCLLDKKDWVHIPNKECPPGYAPISYFKGNLFFSSKNAFTGNTLSRRDDLISVIYLLVFLA